LEASLSSESLDRQAINFHFFIDDLMPFCFSSGVKLVLALTCLLALSAWAQNVDPTLCGAFPKNYKEIIWNWMQGRLVDADSAKIEWQGDPTPADLGKNGEHLYGWLVEFRVNSRNRFGQYTGKQSHGALIRDDQVIKGIGFGYGD
jgi:hypothetical protein